MAASRAKVRAKVAELLARDAARHRPLPVARLARDLGIQVVVKFFDGEEDVSGFYLRDGLERVIGVNEAHAEVRRRFTIAHELGHAVLDDQDGLHIDTAFTYRLRDATSSMAIDPAEMAANQFAAELLMPADEVRERVGAGIEITDDGAMRDLAKHFGVSAQAMAFRIQNLGLGIDGKAEFS
jgi:Zn-dependent peptidase ImmA (M78 family)